METKIMALKNIQLAGEINLPASKSISNRLLIINALSGEKTNINNLSNANDTVILTELLTTKFQILNPELETTNLEPETINCQDAGTVFRFLTAYFAITPGQWVLKGSERMHQRPIQLLVAVLNQLGADITYLENEGYPPLLINGKKLNGGKVTIDASVSSQYISALMMIAPYLQGGLEINLEGKIASQPYIYQTAGLMEQCGVQPIISGNKIQIPERAYKQTVIEVESDWSAASYWYAFAAFAKPHDLVLKGLQPQSLQGDSIVAQWMQDFGVITEYKNGNVILTSQKTNISYFEKDFTNTPDLAPTLVCLCGAMGIPANFYGLESLAIKESDRTAALALELNKVGIKFIRHPKYWQLIPNTQLSAIKSSPTFDTHNDHRLAMALAMFGFVLPGIQINNPTVVKKSYPGFWDNFGGIL